MAGPSATTTILFTDLVNSTELMQRAGDEDAQRIFRAHYQLLREAVSASGGDELKSLGDGLMVTFSSSAAALRCAIAMQQAARRPVHGERIAVRVGVNAGDALRDADDVFGTPVVIARRLCDRATPGQILCSAVVEGLLAGRQAFAFRDLGDLELKGIASPVAAREVVYQAEEPGAFLTHTPFVGREAQTVRLRAALDEARASRGGLVMLVGEPGIGKSRMIEEFSEFARAGGAVVLIGHCFEGEWAPSYGPFAEALDRYVNDADPDALREDLGNGGPALARIAPALRNAIPGLPDPPPLQPDEERFRLLDAVAQLLVAMSQRAPVVFVLDDLHWADRGTIAMLRHIARFAPKNRMLLLGAYRDVELDRQHPLSDALAALRREAEYERIALKGLDQADVGALLAAIAEQEVNAALVQAISDETDGNPFFIREVLAHLVEERKLYREDGVWKSDAQSIAQLGIPEGVRQVIGRRVSRLSDDANRLLTAASGFNGPFQLDLAAAAATIDEARALDAIDEALQAQLLRPANAADAYDFTHALIRHTLYGELSPSRQVRLHRQIAEAMERRYGDSATDHASELAYQYHRSAAISGAVRGVDYALRSADRAEAAFAWDEAASFLSMTLDLMDDGDERRADVTGRMAIALGWALRDDEALAAARAAIGLLERTQGGRAAGEFASVACYQFWGSGFPAAAWDLSQRAVALLGDARDLPWARARGVELQRLEALDPDNPGIPRPSPQWLELIEVLETLDGEEADRLYGNATFVLHPARSRDEMLALLARARTGEARQSVMLGLQAFQIGLYDAAEDYFANIGELDEDEGRIAPAVAAWSQVARMQVCRGELEDARRTIDHIADLVPRLSRESVFLIQYLGALDEEWFAIGGSFAPLLARFGPLAGSQDAANRWVMAAVLAALGRGMALDGSVEQPLAFLAQVLPSIEQADGATANYPRVVCHAAEILWHTNRTDHAGVIERSLREKVIAPDFRYPMVDARRSLAQICALSGRLDEARDWFARARSVLDEQGARPLRAIVDYDEALMYMRRSAPGDADRAQPLLAAATQQFREIGMTGWLDRAAKLAG